MSSTFLISPVLDASHAASLPHNFDDHSSSELKISDCIKTNFRDMAISKASQATVNADLPIQWFDLECLEEQIHAAQSSLIGGG